MGVLAVYVCTLRRSLLSTILFRSFMSEVTDKQGCQCFSKKQTGYGQRVLQCPHALPSVPITIKIQPAVFLHSHWCLSLPPAFFFFTALPSVLTMPLVFILGHLQFCYSLHGGGTAYLPVVAQTTHAGLQKRKASYFLTFLPWITCASVGTAQPETCVRCLTLLHPASGTFPEQRCSSPPAATQTGEDTSVGRLVQGHPSCISGVC